MHLHVASLVGPSRQLGYPPLYFPHWMRPVATPRSLKGSFASQKSSKALCVQRVHFQHAIQSAWVAGNMIYCWSAKSRVQGSLNLALDDGVTRCLRPEGPDVVSEHGDGTSGGRAACDNPTPLVHCCSLLCGWFGSATIQQDLVRSLAELDDSPSRLKEFDNHVHVGRLLAVPFHAAFLDFAEDFASGFE